MTDVAADPAGWMTPDTPDGRERIARLESQVDDVERQVERNERTFGPLPLAVERLQWTIDAINMRLDKRDREDDERFEKLTRSFENQITACSSAISRVSDTMREHHEAEQKRREKERERRERREADEKTAEEQTKAQRFVARYGLITGLIVVLISSVTSIVIAIIGGG